MEELKMEKINEKTTVLKIKEELEFLRMYEKKMKLYTYVTLETIDYIKFSSSFFTIQDGNSNFDKNHVLDAIQKKEKEEKRRQLEQLRAETLKEGILLLDEKYRTLITYVYIENLPTTLILQKMGGVVITTYRRILKKAYIQLAYILDLVVYNEKER